MVISSKLAVNPNPIRLSVKTAAACLDCTPETVRRYVRGGLLRGIYPRGFGPGKPVYVDACEVELFALGRFDELREYQRRFIR